MTTFTRRGNVIPEHTHMMDRFRIYRDPFSAPSTLLGMRGTTHLEIPQAFDVTRPRTIVPCPNAAFYDLRVLWFREHWHLDAETAAATAYREQSLRLLYTAARPVPCEYTFDALHEIYATIPLEDVDLRGLLSTAIRREMDARSQPRFFEISSVMRPYVPAGMKLDPRDYSTDKAR